MIEEGECGIWFVWVINICYGLCVDSFGVECFWFCKVCGVFDIGFLFFVGIIVVIIVSVELW